MKSFSKITILFLASITHSYAYFVEISSHRLNIVSTTFFDTSGNRISPIHDVYTSGWNGFYNNSGGPASSLGFYHFSDFTDFGCSGLTTEQQINECVNYATVGSFWEGGDTLRRQTLVGTATQDMYVQIEGTVSGNSYYRTDKPEWFDVSLSGATNAFELFHLFNYTSDAETLDFTEPFELIEEETSVLTSYFVKQGDHWSAENSSIFDPFSLYATYSDKFREDFKQHLLDELNTKNPDDNINAPVPIPVSLYLFASSITALFGYRVRKKSTV